MKRVLAFCAHPDDEVIGIGGTIRKLVNQGFEVNVVTFATGNEGYSDIKLRDKIVEIRREEREIAGKILGIKAYETFDYEDYSIPANSETYKICIKMIRKYKPDIIFAHYWLDYMSHKAVATVATEAWWQAGWECSLELGEPWKAKAFYYFEVLDMLPYVTHIVDITDTLGVKLQAMKAYASQIGIVPTVLERIQSLAMLRGATVGIKYGEALLKSSFIPQTIKGVEEL